MYPNVGILGLNKKHWIFLQLKSKRKQKTVYINAKLRIKKNYDNPIKKVLSKKEWHWNYME